MQDQGREGKRIKRIGASERTLFVHFVELLVLFGAAFAAAAALCLYLLPFCVSYYYDWPRTTTSSPLAANATDPGA